MAGNVVEIGINGSGIDVIANNPDSITEAGLVDLKKKLYPIPQDNLDNILSTLEFFNSDDSPEQKMQILDSIKNYAFTLLITKKYSDIKAENKNKIIDFLGKKIISVLPEIKMLVDLNNKPEQAERINQKIDVFNIEFQRNFPEIFAKNGPPFYHFPQKINGNETLIAQVEKK